MKLTFYCLLLLGMVFFTADVSAQIPQCTDNVVGNYFDYDNPMDYLYSVETQTTCVTEMIPNPDNLDYMTAHTSRVDVYGDVIIDEAINLCKIYMNSALCGGVNDIENIFVNISIPDPNAATLTDTNYETIYDLRKTNHPDFIIGTGVYYQLATCTGGTGGSGGIGGAGGPAPTTNVSIPWPFYFKFNIVTNSFVYFKRLKKPGTGNCGKIPLDAIPTDIEMISNSQYVICLSEGVDRGLLRINGNNGAIIGLKKYGYGQGQFFDPVDVEVYNNKLYAVGRIQLKPSNIYQPALLSTNKYLTGLKLKRYNVSGSTSNPDHLKMTAVQANPVSNSLLLTGWALNGLGDIVAIHVDNLTTLDLDWYHNITGNISNGIHNFGWAYGLENLSGSSSFALHAWGTEIYGLDAKNSNYLLTIGSDVNDPVSIRGLHNGFYATAKNPIPTNNTLVQSPRTGNLAMVMHRDELSNIYTPISLLNTNLSTNTEDCFAALDSDVESPNTQTFDVSGFYTASNSGLIESVQPAVITEVPASWNVKCVEPIGGGPGGGMGARLENPNKTSANVEDSNTNFSISPNPASSIITFDKIGDYQIFDLNGRIKIDTKQVDQIDLSNLPPGIYFIMNEYSKVEKLIIN